VNVRRAAQNVEELRACLSYGLDPRDAVFVDEARPPGTWRNDLFERMVVRVTVFDLHLVDGVWRRP
jgi:hypothetical protein